MQEVRLAARFLKCSLHALQKFHHHFQAADLTQVKNFSEEMMSTRGVGSFILSIALAVVIENVVRFEKNSSHDLVSLSSVAGWYNIST